MNDFPDEQVAFAALRGPLRLEDALFTARKSNKIAPLQVVRHDLVLGSDHIRSAALHAHRAQAEGRMHAKTLEVEFVRYLAGERQISAALDKMGLPDDEHGAPAAVVVALGPKRMDALQHFVHSLGLVQDNALADASDEKLAAFGVTQRMLQATTPDHHRDIVLEMVAAVDLMRT